VNTKGPLFYGLEPLDFLLHKFATFDLW